MARMLDESEIDEWFQQEKERLSERMYAVLQRGGDFAKEQERFDKEFRKLLAEYDAKFRTADAVKARQERFERPRLRLRAWRRERLLSLRIWWKRRQELRKKEKFEREYRKLFHLQQRKI